MPRAARARRKTAHLTMFSSGIRQTEEYSDDTAEAESDEHVEEGTAGPHYMTREDIRHACNIAMRDLPWKPYLHGKEVRHKADVLRAYNLELDSLLSTVLREVKEGDAEWEAATSNYTTCRALLEWKRQGLWKVRVVIQGHKEDRIALDGPDFEYASDVVGLTAIRALFLKPLKKGEAIG